MPVAAPGATTKECSRCRATKPLSAFREWNLAPDGLFAACRDCVNADRRRSYTIESDREQRERYRAAHPDWQEKRRARYRVNPGPYKTLSTRRRALIAGNGSEPYDRLEIYDRDQGICHLCHEFVEWDDFSIDHLIPISKGGPDTPANVATSHLRCNLSRGNRPLNRGGQ
jgi:5-methylcytosine-specific restriction endonuclease McrA